jgi:hypothetical protein
MARLRARRRLRRETTYLLQASEEYQRKHAAYSADYSQVIQADSALDEA